MRNLIQNSCSDSFIAQCLPVVHAGEHLLLHPQKALYWPAQHTLFVADVHAGKEQVFGRHGIAIPAGISESTLQRLFRLAAECACQRLIVLGDFMHAVPGISENWLQQLSTLLDTHSQLSLEVVAGNHDRQAGRSVTDARLTWHNSSLVLEGLALHHEPCEDSRGFVLSGHLHPAYRFGNARRGGIRAPVFWFRKEFAVLPAFGEFTGGMIIDPDAENDSVYITGPDCVMQIPLKAARKVRKSAAQDRG